MSVLKATHRESVSSIVAVQVGIAAAEVEVVGEGAKNRTAPIVAVGPHKVERTIAEAAVARQRQLQW